MSFYQYESSFADPRGMGQNTLPYHPTYKPQKRSIPKKSAPVMVWGGCGFLDDQSVCMDHRHRVANDPHSRIARTMRDSNHHQRNVPEFSFEEQNRFYAHKLSQSAKIHPKDNKASSLLGGLGYTKKVNYLPLFVDEDEEAGNCQLVKQFPNDKSSGLNRHEQIPASTSFFEFTTRGKYEPQEKQIRRFATGERNAVQQSTIKTKFTREFFAPNMIFNL